MQIILLNFRQFAQIAHLTLHLAPYGRRKYGIRTMSLAHLWKGVNGAGGDTPVRSLLVRVECA